MHKPYETHQALPRILIQEPHSDIKRRATPTFKTVCIRQRITRLLRNVHHINCAQAGGEQGLMRVSPRRVHDQAARILADCFRECLRPVFDDDIAPADGAWEVRVERRAILWVLATLQLGDDDLGFETRLALPAMSVSSNVRWSSTIVYSLALDRTSIHGQVSEIC
jgi:hypothetical protein